MSELKSISPLDGRYQNDVKDLSPIFSESALMKYRLIIEIEYLLALSHEPKIKEVREFNDQERVELRMIYEKFSEEEALKVKKIEKTTNHDVKSVEYYLKDKLKKINGLKDYLEFVHFALTSEDVNNLAYSLMLKDGVAVYLRSLRTLLKELKSLSWANKNVALLSLTHGQPASPTTVGKELAVFYYRLFRQLDVLSQIKLQGKFSGAVGNWSAQAAAYGRVDWPAFSQTFIESFGLEFNPLTTQIESHDGLAQVYHALIRINNIIRDLNQDVWLYISRGVLKQHKVKGEVGSSTMPHKINPWKFENSDGNLGLANALLSQLANQLPVSKLQRDLSDSTALRNQGAALAYALLALKSTLDGLARLEVDRQAAQAELDNHWEILAEPIQVVLRRLGYDQPYEKLKQLTRGVRITRAALQQLVRGLKIPKPKKDQLLKLTPEKYIGLAAKLVEKYLK